MTCNLRHPMSLRHPVGGCIFGLYGEDNSKIRKGSCRDVTWRGLVGTWRLICDWSYLLTFRATGLALRIVFLGYRPIRKLTSIRRLKCPISGRRGKNGGDGTIRERRHVQSEIGHVSLRRLNSNVEFCCDLGIKSWCCAKRIEKINKTNKIRKQWGKNRIFCGC